LIRDTLFFPTSRACKSGSVPCRRNSRPRFWSRPMPYRMRAGCTKNTRRRKPPSSCCLGRGFAQNLPPQVSGSQKRKDKFDSYFSFMSLWTWCCSRCFPSTRACWAAWSIGQMPTFSPVIEFLPELRVARLDLTQLFGRIAPLHLDLGCGDGSFLCEMAQQFPKRNFLGIERLTKRVERVRQKAKKIENVRVLRADTLFALNNLLPERSVEVFYLLFPDPWPKRRHQFRRIFTPDFLDAIAVALEQRGVLRVATDHLDYFQQIERLSRVHVQFEVVPQSADDAIFPVTKFERKFLAQGAPIYRLALRKTSPVR